MPQLHLQDLFDRSRFDAFLFDLDGVLTATARLHAAAWKRMFDEFLRRYSSEHGIPFREFDSDNDYKLYVDGRPRYEGVQCFLESRGIDLPRGEPIGPGGTIALTPGG